MIKCSSYFTERIMDMEYSIIRSKRKTISVEITRDAKVIVRAPLKMRPVDIEQFLNDKSTWIDKTLEKVKASKEDTSLPPFSAEEIALITKRAKEYISNRVSFFADVMGVSFGRICIKHQKTRWGSCSGKGNLNFNCLLMLCPLEVIDYVIIHELCHLKHPNHSKDFWNEVEKYMSDYKVHKKWLKDKGHTLISRLEEVK